MPRLLITLFFILLLSANTNAQCDSLFFRYTGAAINGISLIDYNKIIGVGNEGQITKSINGGKTWRNIPSPSIYNLHAVQSAADGTVYAVGNSTSILKSEDEGETWFSLAMPVPNGYNYDGAAFKDLYFFNKNRGYLVGSSSLLITTNDGGRSWVNLNFNSSNNLNSITFISDSIGFVCGSSGTLQKTENGGRTWQAFNLDSMNASDNYVKVRFVNKTTGFAIGFNGTCVKTTDAGVSWKKISMPRLDMLSDICFISETKGFMLTAFGPSIILETTDIGETWNPANIPASYLRSYRCLNTDPEKQKLVIAGGGWDGSRQSARPVLQTTDVGASFAALSSNDGLTYNDLFFLNDSTGFIAGDQGVVLKTTDYGESWRSLTNVPSVTNIPVSKMFFLDSLNAYAATDNIYKTTDGAKTWQIATTPGTIPNFFATSHMHFYDMQKGIVMNNQVIYKTVDGGNSWSNVATSDSYSAIFRDITIAPDGRMFVVGYDGLVIVSADEGSSWTKYNLNTTKYLTSIYFYNNTTGFIGTADKAIFKTTDGGITWTQIDNDFLGLEFIEFRFVSSTEGYMIGKSTYGGTSWIYKTKNGGLIWGLLRQESGNIKKIDGFNILYMVSENGVIVRSDKVQKPGIPGYILGPVKGCVGSSSVFKTGAMYGVDYSWTLSGGGVNSFRANNDTINWSSPGVYTLSYSVTNACGVSPVRSLDIEVIAFIRVITIQDTVLTATEGSSYRWFINGAYIPDERGGNLRSITGKVSGNYSVDVKSFYGCTVRSAGALFSAIEVINLCPGGNTTIFAGVFGTSYQWQRNDGSGFVNISNNSFYSGATTSSLKIAGAPSSWYGYRFRCVTNFGTGDVSELQFSDTWTGNANAAWENPSNWSCGKVPDANTDVVISDGPVVINSNVTIRRLILNPMVTLTIQTGNTLTITH